MGIILTGMQGFELDFTGGWEPAKKNSDMAQTSYYLDWKKRPKPAYYTGIYGGYILERSLHSFDFGLAGHAT